MPPDRPRLPPSSSPRKEGQNTEIVVVVVVVVPGRSPSGRVPGGSARVRFCLHFLGLHSGSNILSWKLIALPVVWAYEKLIIPCHC